MAPVGSARRPTCAGLPPARLWGRSCREHQEGLLADDSSSSEIHASWGCSAGLTAPLSGQRTAGPWERPRGWPGAGPGRCRQRASLSDFLRALRGPGSASRHVWHSGLGCKIYPARQLVKELCNRRQLTETTSLSSWEARSLAVPPWPQAQGRSGWQGQTAGGRARDGSSLKWEHVTTGPLDAGISSLGESRVPLSFSTSSRVPLSFTSSRRWTPPVSQNPQRGGPALREGRWRGQLEWGGGWGPLL